MTGTFVLTDGPESRPARRILLSDGVVVAGHFGEPGMGLLSELIPLCKSRSGHYLFVEGEDLVGGSRDVVRGRVDPYMLLAAALRSEARDDLVEATLAGLRQEPLRIRPDCPLVRFGFTRDEWNFVQDVRRVPGTLDDILAREVTDPAIARRLVHLLLQTGVMVQGPAAPGRSRVGTGPGSGAAAADEDPGPVPTERPPAGEVVPDPLSEHDSPVHGSFPAGMERDGRHFEAERCYHHALRLTKRQLYMAALQQIDAALRLQPMHPDALALKGFALWRMESDPRRPAPEVMAAFDEALAIDPDCERAHHYCGVVLKTMGRDDEANTHFARAAALDETNTAASEEVRNYVRRRSLHPPESFWCKLRRSIPPFRRAG